MQNIHPCCEESLEPAGGYKLEPLSGLPPPYPCSLPSLPSLATPDPDSALVSPGEAGRDTPDSSIKEEPSEDLSEAGATTCRWRSCGKEFSDRDGLVEHIKTCHEEYRLVLHIVPQDADLKLYSKSYFLLQTLVFDTIKWPCKILTPGTGRDARSSRVCGTAAAGARGPSTLSTSS